MERWDEVTKNLTYQTQEDVNRNEHTKQEEEVRRTIPNNSGKAELQENLLDKTGKILKN